MTSTPSETAKSAAAPPQGEVDLHATVTGAPNARLMLVRHDGQRRWWFEPQGNTTCLVEGATENCWFDELPRGIYTLRLIRNGLSRPASVTWRFQGEEHTAELDALDTYVVTIVPRDLVVHPPEVDVPGGNVTQALAAFKPAARFCAAAAGANGVVEGFEVKVAFKGEVPTSVVRATPPNPAAEACVAGYLDKLDPVEDPQKEASFYLLVPD